MAPPLIVSQQQDEWHLWDANSVSIVAKGNVQGPLKTQSLLIVVLAKLYIIQK